MKKIIVLFFMVLLFFSNCSALEWKRLHEDADRKTLPQALDYVKNNPESQDGLYELGLVYLNLHRDKEAKEAFNKVLSLNPKATEAKWGVAEVLRREHDLTKSEELLKEAIKEDSDFSPAYITLAYIRYYQMKFEEAVRLANKVIKQGRENVDLSNYVRAYLLLGGCKGMIAHYGGPISKIVNGTAVLSNIKRAQALQPDNAGVMFGLGSFYLLAPALAGGDIDKAEEYLNKAVKLDPLFADAYVRLAQLYKMKGDNQNYEIYLNKALKIDPKNKLGLDTKSGECKFVCGRSPG